MASGLTVLIGQADARANEPTPVVVTHGSQLTSAIVGPGAIGITTFSVPTVPSSITIYDETSTNFITKINAGATYDGITIGGPHLLIQGVEIDAGIDDYSPIPLVVRGCKIVLKTDSYWGIHSRTGAGPLYVLYSDLTCLPGGISNGEFIWFDSSNSVALRNHMHNVGDDAMQVGGGATNLQILENLMEQWTPAVGAHNDGVQFDGSATGVVINRNKILLNTGETSTFNMAGWTGTTSQTSMDSNYLAGGSYCFMGSQGQGNAFTNNILGTDFYSTVGQWGPVYPGQWLDSNTWMNNKLSTGTLIDHEGNPIVTYDAWKPQKFTPAELINQNISGKTATPAGDGICNLVKYALGLDPKIFYSASNALPHTRQQAISGTNYMTFSFTRDTNAKDVTYRVEVANVLNGAWTAMDPLVPANQIAVLSDTPVPGIQTITIKDIQPANASLRRFMRLRLEIP